MAGKFECYTDKAGEHRFRLKAPNGEVILTSEGYKEKSSCEKGVASVRKNSADDTRYEKKTTDNGMFHFNLKASNGQVIGTSQTYKTESGCDNGIASVKQNAADAAVVDVE